MKPDIRKSEAWYARAKKLIPNGTMTLAKGPTQFVDGVAPKYLEKGKGSYVWDVDGNKYLDYNMGIGPLSLGYAYDSVDAAIRKQLEDGITFSLMHPLEVEVAELIHEIIPNAEAIKFSKTGADVTSAAIRLARAFTGRNKVLCCGYHGWHDWYIGTTTRNAGIPQAIQDLTSTFNYNDIESVRKSLDNDTAALIIEPVTFIEPKDDFLKKVRDLCQQNGTLLIFDEMWTGFRLALGGAQEYFGIKPDLATYSKAVANGMPLSVLTGRHDVMALCEESIFFFTTFGGEALSLAAAKATILEMKNKQVIDHLRNQGGILKDGFNQLARELQIPYIQCVGYPFRSMITFDGATGDQLVLKSFVQQELIKRGILWSGFHTISYSHTEADIKYTLKVYAEVLPLLKAAVEKNQVESLLEGKPVQPAFRRATDFNTKPRKSA